MKNNTKLFSAIIVLIAMGCRNDNSIVQGSPIDKIVIQVELTYNVTNPQPENFTLKSTMNLEYLPIDRVEFKQQKQSVNALVSGGKVKWVFYSGKPVTVNYGFGRLEIVSPGDSIYINYNGEDYIYSGKGADKFNIWNEIKGISKKLTRPLQNNTIRSLDEYFQWNRYVDNKLALQMPLLDSFKTGMSSGEYDYLKTCIVYSAESDRIQTFQALRAYSQKDSLSGLTLSDLNIIWDSTQNKSWSKWLRSLPIVYGDISGLYGFNKIEVWRRFNFDKNNDSLRSKETRNYLYYTNAKQKYQGLLRERMLALLLDEQTHSKESFKSAITQKMLKDYYSQPGFPEYKIWVKELEGEAKSR